MSERPTGAETLSSHNEKPIASDLSTARDAVRFKHGDPLPTAEQIVADKLKFKPVQDFLNSPSTLEDLYANSELLRLLSMMSQSAPHVVDDRVMDQLKGKVRPFLEKAGYVLNPQMDIALDKNGYTSITRESFAPTAEGAPGRVIFNQKVIIGMKDGKPAPETVGKQYRPEGKNFQNK